MQLTKEYLEEQKYLGKTVSEIAKENNLTWRQVYERGRTVGVIFNRTRGATKNLKGVKCGKLTVKKQLKRKSKNQRHTQWLCDCECGNTTVVLSSAITRKRTQSCGCLIYENKPNWKGYGEISGTHFTSIETSARKRNLQFDITIEDIWKLFLKQDRKCALTGQELKFSRKRNGLQTASLDRIDSSKGYTIDNVQWVHRDINWLKNKWGQEKFIKMCKLVADHNNI